MRKVRAVAAWLLALVLIVFGGNYFVDVLEFEPQGAQEGIDVLLALRAGGLMAYVSASHLLVGAGLLLGRTRFAAAFFQLHITLGIVAFHLALLPEGLGPAVVLLVLNVLALDPARVLALFVRA